MSDVKMDAPALRAFLESEFPQIDGQFVIEEIAPMRARVALPVTDANLRPGGTVSGPSMFALADLGVYVAVLSMVGPKALAVTTNCSIDFMRKPRPDVDLVAEVELLKLGRSLAVGDVRMWSRGAEQALVARASLTYSLPLT